MALSSGQQAGVRWSMRTSESVSQFPSFALAEQRVPPFRLIIRRRGGSRNVPGRDFRDVAAIGRIPLGLLVGVDQAYHRGRARNRTRTMFTPATSPLGASCPVLVPEGTALALARSQNRLVIAVKETSSAEFLSQPGRKREPDDFCRSS